MKSIIIFGKGPSVSKCSKEIVEKYDDVAIVNYPVLTNFFYKLISNREIEYHFANCSDFDKRYKDHINDMLKIKNIINTHVHNNYVHYLKNNLIKCSIREKYETYFKNNFDLDPNSGIMALQFLIDTGAEISVMSKNTAIACGLSKYIDESYCGKLIGTGETKIMGKVHYTEIVFDWGVLPCGFTICNTENITSIIGIRTVYLKYFYAYL